MHLLGAAEQGGHLLDHLEFGFKHNETSHFTELLEPLDLAGAVVTADTLHTVRANLHWLVKDKKAHYIAIVKKTSRCCTPSSGPCPGGRYLAAPLPGRKDMAAPRPAS